MDCQFVCQTGVTGKGRQALCYVHKHQFTKPCLHQLCQSLSRKAEGATSHICQPTQGFRHHQSWQMSMRLPHSADCCTTGGSCPRTAWSLGCSQDYSCLSWGGSKIDGTSSLAQLSAQHSLVLCVDGSRGQSGSGPTAPCEHRWQPVATGCRPTTAIPALTHTDGHDSRSTK